jgi:hypothetical protein
MKNNFMYLFSILLIGISNIESSQEAVGSRSILSLAYQGLLDKTIEEAGTKGDAESIALFQNKSGTIETILSPDTSYETKRDAFLGLLDMKMAGDTAVGKTLSTEFKKNESIIRFLSQCYALDVQGKSGGLSSAQTFFNTLLKSKLPPVTKVFIQKSLNIEQIQMFESEQEPKDSKLLELNELCKDITSVEDAEKIKNPLIKALAASRIVGKYAGNAAFKKTCTDLMIMIKNAVTTPNFLNKFPNTWTTLVKQSLDGIAGDDKKSTLEPTEEDLRSNNLEWMEAGFKASIKERKSAARTKGSWFREYCSISRIVLRARSAFMSDEKRYKTTMKLAQSLTPNSKLDPRDVAIKIGIVLQNLSGKNEVNGQPEQLLQELTGKNITVGMINDEIISRVPNLSVKKGNSRIALEDIFNRSLVDVARSQSSSDDITNFDERTAFDLTTTGNTIQDPMKPVTTSTETDRSLRDQGTPAKPTSTKETREKQQVEKAKKFAAEKLAAEKLDEARGVEERPR